MPAPFIVTYKDPRAILHSGWVRAGRPEVMGWLAWVEAEMLGYLLALYEQQELHRMQRRVLFVSLEALCLATGQTCEQAFEHAGLAFDPGYLVLRGTNNRATHGGTIHGGRAVRLPAGLAGGGGASGGGAVFWRWKGGFTVK